MSKPSITNCPNTFFIIVHSFNCIFSSLSCFACVQIRHTPLSGGYCGEVPPLPIPNREVKLTCADGTAMQCGRVGSRLLSISEASITKVVGAFLFFPLISLMLTDFSQIFTWEIQKIGKHSFNQRLRRLCTKRSKRLRVYTLPFIVKVLTFAP